MLLYNNLHYNLTYNVVKLKTTYGASPMVQRVKNPPAVQEMQETWVQTLGWEDPLKEGMAIHSSILAWKIPWTKEPDWIQFMGSQRVGHG